MRELSWVGPVGPGGAPPLDRSCIFHYLTMGEYLEAVVSDDFELGTLRRPLEKAVATYDTERQAVVLWRARCGHLAVLVVPLVPDFGICKRLGEDYAHHDALQLNLDDH
ncbi:unnamed protein product [Phaeothamnion confervicola]